MMPARMPLDTALFADKLRRYREQFRATVEEVAAATGISADSVRALEAAERQPSGDEVLILADYFKCDYKFFVSNEQLAPFEQTEELFRRLGEEFSVADRWAIQEFLYLSENETFLAEALELPAPRVFRFVKQGNYYKGHGQQAALHLRRHLAYEPHVVPVDVFDDFRAVGVHVFRRRLENSNISGMFVKHPTAGKCILINYSEDVYRQRFTAAHEAGHSILDDEQDFVVSFTRDQSALVETRANTFAAHYLVPPEFLQRLPATSWTTASILELASRLRVNVDVLVIALQQQQLLDPEAAVAFRGLKIPRVEKLDAELPPTLSAAQRLRKSELLSRGISNRYARLCFDAYDRGLVSAARVAEMMLSGERDLVEIGLLYGWRSQHGS
jgi:Zn-dependent peptidase ImmA (M78 family)/transcriptional regulator with XRE-family HTH domain